MMKQEYTALLDEEAKNICNKHKPSLKQIEIMALLQHMAFFFDRIYCLSPKRTEAVVHAYTHLLSDKWEIGKSDSPLSVEGEQIDMIIADYLSIAQYYIMRDSLLYEDWRVEKIANRNNHIRFTNLKPQAGWEWEQINGRYELFIGYYLLKNYLFALLYHLHEEREINDDNFNRNVRYYSYREYFDDIKLLDITLEFEKQIFTVQDLLYIYSFISAHSFTRYTAILNELAQPGKGYPVELSTLYAQAQLKTQDQYRSAWEPATDRDENETTDISYTQFREYWKPNQSVTREQVRAMLHFICYDINKPLCAFKFTETPFIKINRTINYLPNVIGNINLHYCLHNYLLRSGILKEKQIRKHTQNLEKKIAGLLKKNGFEVCSGLPLPSGRGEIDVLALQGNILFVIEVKSTYIRAEYQQIMRHILSDLKKGAAQLTDALTYIRKNLPEFLEKLGADMNREVEIYPLLVSTSFEGDNERFMGIKKISYFELMGILTNIRRYLDHTAKLLQFTKEGRSQEDFMQQHAVAMQEELIAFNQIMPAISGAALRESIEQRLFWKGLIAQESPAAPVASIKLGKWEVEWKG